MTVLDAHEVWETLQSHGASDITNEKQAYRYGLAGHQVQLLHPTRTDQDAEDPTAPLPVLVQADRIDYYIGKGFTLPEKPVEAKRAKLEQELVELEAQARSKMRELDALDSQPEDEPEPTGEPVDPGLPAPPAPPEGIASQETPSDEEAADTEDAPPEGRIVRRPTRPA